ncbi:TetR/AcrR family transcriptional regulator [Oleiagrimonas sp. MCCC 1A03011]|uniref:TetR/AcrR family transcriptional regulator n=1 Tax=Oleiagrimonas sp. MCCC 1A03011 TaxID=1926883 RepID=UPI00143D88E0|nr:TetR/AcrR family transcriptional regulator [Oleiagrimonas sp. MCCC 1A03011]
MPADRPPQQERSRRTLARLLAATIWTLDELGLENATIPRIARKAEVSPATIYRRFESKQALLRAAFLHMLKRSNQANRERAGEKLGGSLERAARTLIDHFFAQFRQHYHLLRALDRFMETDDDPAFVEAAQAIERDNLEQIVQAMLAHRAAIAHPDPERAVRIATLTAATTINTIAFKPRNLWRTVLPEANEALAEELTRTYVAYLKSEA